MIVINDKSKCSGCSACYSICPKGAIKMVFDEEGFRYPFVDTEKCVDCGLCDKVCPEIEPYKNVMREYSSKYAVQNVSDKERNESTAGGFFSIIANYVIEECSGSVFAVGFDENITVVHKRATTKHDLLEMRGSKYVQSDLQDTFKQIKMLLHDGVTCLFVGTPCQVNALEKILSKDDCRKNLITIDLLCLGVPSPALYEKWVKYLENKYKDTVSRVYFREKSYGYATANVRVCFKNRKYIEQSYDAKSLMKTFFSGYNMRPSCFDCAFRAIERASDFTIGDFHQVGKVVPDMDDDKGTTCVWVHSYNARSLMNELKDKMCVTLIENECSSKLFEKSKLVKIPENRTDFFIDVRTMDYGSLANKWAKNDLKGQIINLARIVVNKMPFKSFVFKTMKRIKTKSFQKRVESANKQ